MTSPTSVQGVLLTDEAYTLLGLAIAPYTHVGRVGRYIYCESASQDGAFLTMKFRPSDYSTPIDIPMQISVPLSFVKLIVTGITKSTVGFAPGDDAV